MADEGHGHAVWVGGDVSLWARDFEQLMRDIAVWCDRGSYSVGAINQGTSSWFVTLRPAR